jgi:hypothetical protein
MDIKEIWNKLTSQDKEELQRLQLLEEEREALSEAERFSLESKNSAEKIRLARRNQIKRTNVRRQQIKESKISPARRMYLRNLGKL